VRRHVLGCVQLAQGFLDVAGNRVVVHFHGLDDAVRVDHEGAAQCQAFFGDVHTKGVGQGVGRVAHQRELGLAHGGRGLVPDLVREMGVGGHHIDFRADFLELGVVFGRVFDFGGAVEGEGSRHEDHDRPLALHAFVADFNEFAVVESLGFEFGNLRVDQGHRNSR